MNTDGMDTAPTADELLAAATCALTVREMHTMTERQLRTLFHLIEKRLKKGGPELTEQEVRGLYELATEVLL